LDVRHALDIEGILVTRFVLSCRPNVMFSTSSRTRFLSHCNR